LFVNVNLVYGAYCNDISYNSDVSNKNGSNNERKDNEKNGMDHDADAESEDNGGSRAKQVDKIGGKDKDEEDCDDDDDDDEEEALCIDFGESPCVFTDAVPTLVQFGVSHGWLEQDFDFDVERDQARVEACGRAMVPENPKDMEEVVDQQRHQHHETSISILH
jgi:hypothetical protein